MTDSPLKLAHIEEYRKQKAQKAEPKFIVFQGNIYWHLTIEAETPRGRHVEKHNAQHYGAISSMENETGKAPASQTMADSSRNGKLKGEIMGTNYYYRATKFRRLGWDVEEKHIGKKSSGWQFSFRAHKGEDGKIEIGSWKDWKEVLTRNKAGKIFDEYGEEWSAQEFIAMVEASKTGKNHGEYCGFADGTWNDSEGWSFSATEFC